jgi:hypothetical protein
MRPAPRGRTHSVRHGQKSDENASKRSRLHEFLYPTMILWPAEAASEEVRITWRFRPVATNLENKYEKQHTTSNTVFAI